MSRRELAEAINAWLYRTHNIVITTDGRYIARLERGRRHWPPPLYRAGLRAVLGAATDAELGLYYAGRRPSDEAFVGRDPILAARLGPGCVR